MWVLCDVWAPQPCSAGGQKDMQCVCVCVWSISFHTSDTHTPMQLCLLIWGPRRTEQCVCVRVWLQQNTLLRLHAPQRNTSQLIHTMGISAILCSVSLQTHTLHSLHHLQWEGEETIKIRYKKRERKNIRHMCHICAFFLAGRFEIFLYRNLYYINIKYARGEFKRNKLV